MHYFLVGNRTKWAKNVNIGPIMTKNANFLAKFGLFGPKILTLTGGSKSFSTNVTEKPPRHLVRIVYWSATGSNGPKMPIFGQKSEFWAKFGKFRAKNPNFYGRKNFFWYQHNGKPT